MTMRELEALNASLDMLYGTVAVFPDPVPEEDLRCCRWCEEFIMSDESKSMGEDVFHPSCFAELREVMKEARLSACDHAQAGSRR